MSILIPWPLIREFIHSKQSPHTRLNYELDLNAFQVFLKNAAIESVSLSDLIRYRESLSHYAQLTINRRIATVKSYFRFLVSMGILSRNPAECIPASNSGDYTETQGLTNDEAMAIISAASTNPMHHALISTALYLGLRSSELISIRINDLNSDSGIPTISVLGKGNKKRILPIPDVVLSSIQEYLLTRARIRGGDDFLFSVDGINPIHKNTFRKALKKYCKIAGINKRISPHSCRVTAISNALENGAPILYVTEMGGWTSPSMAMRYDRRRKAIKNSAVWSVNYNK